MSPRISTLFLLLVSSSHATFQQGSKAQGLSKSISRYRIAHLIDTNNSAEAISIPTSSIPDIEIDSHLVRHSLSDSMQQTLDLIKNVESLPSCAKIASSALLHSCSALEGSIKHEETELSRGSDLFVEEEADIYSARLAVCELSGADFSIPLACRSFVPTEQSKKKRGIRGFWSKNDPTQPNNVFHYYEEITLGNLQHCRKALGSTSQSWTSYSNNRQNAVVMCRAMQSQVDKDEHLHVAKVLASAAGSATVSLKDAFEAVNNLKAQFNEVATAMPQLQKDLTAGNEQQLEHVRQFWTETERVRGLLRDVLQDSSDIWDNVQSTKGEAASLVSTMNNVATLNEANEFRLEQFQQGMVKALYQVTQDMDVINAFMPTLKRELSVFYTTSQSLHQETLEKQKDNQAYLDKTAATLEQFSQAASDMNATMASISGFVGIGWPRAMDLLKKLGTFMGYTFVYALFSFGLWEKYGGFYVMGTALVSTATGTSKKRLALTVFRSY